MGERRKLSLGRRVGFGFLTAMTVIQLGMCAARKIGGDRLQEEVQRESYLPRGSKQYLPWWECAERYGYPTEEEQGPTMHCLKRGFSFTDDDSIAVQTNSRGFYGGEIALPKPDNLFRIVALGGSTTEGGYPEALEEIIAQQATGDKEIEVINGGIVSYQSAHLVVRYFKDVLGIHPFTGEHLGTESLDPDMLLLYTGWNDFVGCSVFSDKERGAVYRFTNTGDPSSLRELENPWFSENLPWFEEQRANILNYRDESWVRQFRAKLGRTELVQQIHSQLQRSADLEAIRIWAQRDDFVLEDLDQAIGEPSPFESGFFHTRYYANISRIMEDANERGITPVIAKMPHAYGCRPYNVNNCGGFILSVNDRYQILHNVIYPAIELLAQQHNAVLVDHAPLQEREDICELFHWGDELHYNNVGRDAIAQSTFEAIKPWIDSNLAETQ